MASKTQELPPPGGYQPLNFARKPAKALMPARLANSVTPTCKQEISSPSMYLKQLRRNYDEECDLMKNVEGWVPGTYFGERIYKTLPPDTLYKRNQYEYFAHAVDNAFFKKIDLWLYS